MKESNGIERAFGELPNYMSNKEGVVVNRKLKEHFESLEMLRSYGYNCESERHCGFWLIHWTFPRLKLIGGHALRG